MLCFQEQIKGPENASIARFDGLGCYQTRSEIGADWRGAGGAAAPLATGSASGRKRQKRGSRSGPGGSLAARRSAGYLQGRKAPARRGPRLPCFALFSGANKRPPKTPPSHGLTGLAAIDKGAKKVANGWRWHNLPRTAPSLPHRYPQTGPAVTRKVIQPPHPTMPFQERRKVSER